mmetsp:Transcript_117145/g.203969  ORF Transcript_117145/g.203969 Transcript_117145/m.203969 type:complete len:116 (+) Transcript_117145:1511-1858(+)
MQAFIFSDLKSHMYQVLCSRFRTEREQTEQNKQNHCITIHGASRDASCWLIVQWFGVSLEAKQVDAKHSHLRSSIPMTVTVNCWWNVFSSHIGASALQPPFFSGDFFLGRFDCCY